MKKVYKELLYTSYCNVSCFSFVFSHIQAQK